MPFQTITFADKITGDPLTADNVNEIKDVLNNNSSQSQTDEVALNQASADIVQILLDLAAAVADVGTNTADIAQNQSDIAQNAADIASMGTAVLEVSSTVDQPVSPPNNSPVQVSFGPAVPGGDVSIDAAGLITFNVTKNFLITVTLNPNTNSSNRDFFARFIYNGSQVGAAEGIEMQTSNEGSSMTLQTAISATMGNTMSVECAASGSNVNLESLTPGGGIAAWGPTSSARILITRL